MSSNIIQVCFSEAGMEPYPVMTIIDLDGGLVPVLHKRIPTIQTRHDVLGTVQERHVSPPAGFLPVLKQGTVGKYPADCGIDCIPSQIGRELVKPSVEFMVPDTAGGCRMDQVLHILLAYLLCSRIAGSFDQEEFVIMAQCHIHKIGYGRTVNDHGFIKNTAAVFDADPIRDGSHNVLLSKSLAFF